MSEKHIAFQSIDNQLVSYSASDRLVASGRKIYRGHVVAGNIIRPSFSPDNKYICCGDSSGNVYLWDWKTTKLFKKFKAHNSVVTAMDWLPHETSKMITCSLDATLKLWD
jgi:pre-mRNA-processing factor 17